MVRRVLCLVLLLCATPLLAQLSTGAKFAVAIESNDAEAVKELLEGGAKADTLIEYGEHKITPLMKAAWEGDEAILQILLEAGADINAKSSDGNETALMSAVTRGHTEIVKILLAKKADITPKSVYGFNAFTSAVAANNQEIAGMLLDAGAKIHDGAHGLTPLQFAASSGSIDMINFLVGRGADVNHGVKAGGQTALLSAIYGAQPEAVKRLIELKASVNTKTKDGDTPLKAAQEGDQEEIIAILKAAGAKQ
jgi:ankyrin repeat protein